MRTHLNFSIDSKEITEQITAAATAEAVHEARKVVKKTFDDMLPDLIDKAVASLNYSKQRCAWSTPTFENKVYAAVEKAIGNNIELIVDKIVQPELTKSLADFDIEMAHFINTLDSKLELLVDKKVNEYIANSVLQALLVKKD